MNKKDLENEFIKELIEQTKKLIEHEILKDFECKINILNAGKLKDGKYLINITYINEHKLPKGSVISTNIGIFEEDYKKGIKEEIE